MGKSNRIRVKKAEASIANPIKPKAKTKKYMPKWAATLIVSLCALLLAAIVLLGTLSSVGVFGRIGTAMKSDNFRVSRNMMTYFFQNTYQSTAETFNQYSSSYSLKFSLDTSKSLKHQVIGGEAATDTSGNPVTYADSMFVGEGYADGATWFDYFADQTVTSVTTTLSYCEEAHARGIALEQADYDSIDETMKSIETTASSYGYSLNSYLATVYGKGISQKDVRKAMELETLAQKCATAVQEELLDGIGADKINAEYDSDPLSYNRVDYTQFPVAVYFEDIAKDLLGDGYKAEQVTEKKDELIAKYQAKIDEANKVAEEAAKIKDPAAFAKFMYEYYAGQDYDTELKKKALAESVLPTDEAVLTTIRNKMIETVVADVIAEKTATATDAAKTDDVWKIYDQTITEEFANALNSIKTTMFNNLNGDKDANILDKQVYADDGEDSTESFLEWAFADGRAVGDAKIMKAGAGIDDSDKKVGTEDTSYTVTAYLMRKAEYKDTEASRNVAYALFSSTDDAQKAIDAFKAGTLSVEEFERIVKENNATGNAKAENYTEGGMNLEAFDTWLYAKETTVGTVTATPITADTSFMAAYYYADGEENWYVAVKNAVFSTEYTAFEKNVSTKYTIKTNDGVINSMDA